MSKGRLRRSLSKWADTDDMHARDLRQAYAETSQTTVAEAPHRERVVLQGTLRTVTLRPRGGVPALEAELSDGTGVVTVIWLGRRRISGIEPGRAIRVQGRIGTSEGHRVIFNPRYELMP